MSDNFMRIRKGLIVTPTTSIPTSSVDGAILFDDNEKKFKRWNSNANAWAPLGEGTGELNFLELSNKAHDAESGITGWSTYKDAAQARPVDGTGGTATVVSAISTTSTNPLSGTKSFLFAKGSGNAQGEGWSVDFQIDRARQASVLQIEFDYRLDSGTFVAGSSVDYTPAGDSDLIVYIYDVDNGVTIEPTTFRLYSNSTGITDKFIGNFQTSHNGLNYRLIFHVATTSTAAWTLKVDNIKVKPAKYTYGTPITDWVDFPSVAAGTLITATTTNPTYGNVAYNRAQWRRVGSEMEIRWIFRQTTAGTAGSGAYLFNLPPGYQIDFSKLDVNMPNTGIGTSVNSRPLPNSVFHGTFDNGSGSLVMIGHVSPHSSTQLKVVGQDSKLSSTTYSVSNYWGGSPLFWEFSLPSLNFSLFASVPIAGWSSSVKVAEPMERRDVVCRAYRTGSIQTVTTSITEIIFNAKEYDTTNSYNTSNGRFTAPSSGWYYISYGLCIRFLSGTTRFDSYVKINGTSTNRLGVFHELSIPTNASRSHTSSGVLYLNAGDYISIQGRSYGGNTDVYYSTSTGDDSYLYVSKLPSSQVLADSETVVVRAYNMSGPTLIEFNSNNIGNWTKEVDTHNAFNAASGVFTAPQPGHYLVCAQALLNNITPNGNAWWLASALSSEGLGNIAHTTCNSGTTMIPGFNGSFVITAYKAGAQFQIGAGIAGTGGNRTIRNVTPPTDCTLSITKIK